MNPQRVFQRRWPGQALHMALALSWALGATAAMASLPGGTAAEVNGQRIPERWVDFAVIENQAKGIVDSPRLRAVLTDELITRAVLADRAKVLGLHQAQDVRDREALYRQQLLAQELRRFFASKNPPSEQELKSAYQNQVDALNKAKAELEIRLQQVLVRDKQSAQVLLERARQGEDLAALAQQYSIDRSAQRGGDAGWLLDARMRPEIKQAVTQVADGQLAADVVQTEAGWHVLKRVASRPFEVPSYAQSLDRLRVVVAQQKWVDYVKGLRDKAKISQ